MLINIIPPKKISYLQVLWRTRKYYHLDGLTDVVEDDAKRYYIFLRKRKVQVEIFRCEDDVIKEIQNYLNYTFRHSYLGIHESCFNVLELIEVRKVKMQ